ncbi:MAG: carbonate dehydratase [Gammaproteobacteria bacterium]|nr:carbonate dehydratase [Gammaproteobacteria bacterium]
MKDPSHLLQHNRNWAEEMRRQDPQFFSRLAAQQRPAYLWIGCSDSRVPANQIVNLMPGEVFVHRNIANLVHTNDINCLAVIQFAVEVLNVKHIILCGHYGCGGVQAAIDDNSHGLVDYWVWSIKLTYKRHRSWLDRFAPERRPAILCELNVIEQVSTLSCNRVIQQAWSQGNPLQVHSWIYGIQDGLLRDLGMCCSAGDDPEALFREALENIKRRADGV